MQYKMDKAIHGTIGKAHYQCTIEWHNGKFISDELSKAGGKDEGPDPFTLLLSSLASCTLMTLRMYIDRKGWDIPSMAVNANLYQDKNEDKLVTTIDRDIMFLSPVDEEKKSRLQEIARACPISKLLENDIKIRTFVFRDGETKVINYANEEITVEWKPEFCQHSTRCFTQLPEVFNPKEKKWVDPNGAPAERIEKQVSVCPSGALRFHYNKEKSQKS